MTTYVAPKAGAGYQPRSHLHCDVIVSEFDIAAAVDAVNGGGAGGTALALNDVIQMVKVQKGQTVLNVSLYSDDMDGGSGIVLDVGIGGDADKFIDGSTIGQAGGVLMTLNAKDGFGYTFTADDTIDILVETAAASAAATTGKLKLIVYLTSQS